MPTMKLGWPLVAAAGIFLLVEVAALLEVIVGLSDTAEWEGELCLQIFAFCRFLMETREELCGAGVGVTRVGEMVL